MVTECGTLTIEEDTTGGGGEPPPEDGGGEPPPEDGGGDGGQEPPPEDGGGEPPEGQFDESLVFIDNCDIQTDTVKANESAEMTATVANDNQSQDAVATVVFKGNGVELDSETVTISASSNARSSQTFDPSTVGFSDEDVTIEASLQQGSIMAASPTASALKRFSGGRNRTIEGKVRPPSGGCCGGR